MTRVVIKSKAQITRELDKFLDEYGSLYDSEALYYILNNFWKKVSSKDSPDILMQVYGELGIEPTMGKSFYNAHLSKIEEIFGLDKNILDVASGMIPTFANKVAKRQLEIQKGTITIYEPLLLKTTPKYPNMTLHREYFTSETHIKEFDLLTGILACEATETIIESACKNKKDFYIAMCGCTHFKTVYPLIPVYADSYQDYVISKAQKLLKEYDNGELVIDHLDGSYNLNYPIIYNRHH